MRQAAPVSDNTACIYLGRLIDYRKTDQIFTNPRLEHDDFRLGLA